MLTMGPIDDTVQSVRFYTGQRLPPDAVYARLEDHHPGKFYVDFVPPLVDPVGHPIQGISDLKQGLKIFLDSLKWLASFKPEYRRKLRFEFDLDFWRKTVQGDGTKQSLEHDVRASAEEFAKTHGLTVEYFGPVE